ncbi:RHS repeat domain-containing protein [Arenimonas fontis]|uniref:RHS repeat protein n=1 Tax=Arenimonas fontis TaxID=2608255 RepID=A0A5B2ZC09_9GAMM|nr:RHS repeat-associated core domain-containing protein [Arenimonas fontis]KAA2284724.1 RHS repeat protein [Arenimonas fontis]
METMRMTGIRVMAVALLALLAPQAGWGQYYADDHHKRIQSASVVGSIGDEAFGEQVNLYKGTTAFRHTDLSIPGNSGLTVAISRRLDVEGEKGSPRGFAFGDWDLEVPHIGASVLADVGWKVSTSNPMARCSSPQTRLEAAPPGYNGFMAYHYWRGFELFVPGEGGRQLLFREAALPTPAGGPYPWLTKDFWQVGCLPSLASGQGGEGFLAVAPDGTKYWFDWLVLMPEKTIGRSELNQEQWGNGRWVWFYEPRSRARLYATRVEDRFGNWVSYHWSGSRLTGITASDGRAIAVSWRADGRVASVSSGGRTVAYGYGGGGELSTVTLPDGSKWTLQMAGIYPPHWGGDGSGDDWDWASPWCGFRRVLSPQTATGSITHPAGATATFTFRWLRHVRAGVPDSHCSYGTITAPSGMPNTTGEPDQPWDFESWTPRSFDVVGIVGKQVSGPGLPVAQWTFSYGNGPVAAGDYGPQTRSVTVAGPEGIREVYTFGNRYERDEGQLLSQETWFGDVRVRQEVHEYVSDPTGQPFPDRVGVDPSWYSDVFWNERLRPLRRLRIVQDGVTFSRDITAFDAFARPTAVTRSSTLGYQRSEQYAYHDHLPLWVLGQLASETVAGVVVREVGFDSLARPVWRKAFGLLEQSLSYHADGTVRTVTDGRGQATTLTDWKRGIPQTIGQADGTVVKAGVNDQGWIVWREDERGSRTCYGYDGMGRVSGVTWPSGSQAGVCDASAWAPTGYAYAQVASSEYGLAAGHWRVVESRGDYRKATYYDGLWRPVIAREYDAADPTGTQHFRGWRHDAYGRVVFEGYPRASASSIASFTEGVGTTYDALGRVTRVSQDSELGPLVTSTAYLSGFRTRVTHPRGFTTLTEYLAWDTPGTDWPVRIVQAEGQAVQQTTEIARNAFGHPTRLTRSGSYDGSAQSVVRQYVYDAQQRLCKRIEPETGATLFAYDAAGNLAWSAEGTNLTTLSCNRGSVAAADKVLHSYDARNRLILVDYPDSTPDVSTSYHPDGAVHKVISGDVTLTYGYNRLGLLTSERLQYGSLNWLTQYGYTPLGHLATLTYRDGHQVSYAPNALGQPTQAGTYATGVTYHPNGAIKQFTYGNGIVHTLTQNARGLPERSRDALGATVVLDDSYDYDKNGNVLAISDGLTGQPGNRDMSYDALDRLLSVTAGSAQGGNGTFAYDALDNIRRLAQGSRDYRMEYDAANRNHQVRNDAGATVFTQAYDTRGNLVQRQWAGGPTDTFTFDRANRLTASTVGGLSSTYVYDGLGRRVREVTGESTYFQYSQDGKLLYTNDVKTQLRHNHIYLGGSLVAMRTVSFDGATSYIRYQHTDALGSPVAETDESGQVVRRERLTAWGEPADGTWINGPGFTGHRMDAASRLVYMQQRYYDPVTGRFLSVDPVAASSVNGTNFNRYWYGNNNSYRFTDPDGRYSCDVSVCAAIKTYVAAMRESRNSLEARHERRRVDQVLKYIGTEGSGGPHYKPGELKGDTVAHTDQRGTTTIDISKVDNSTTGAMVIGHEASHDMDAQARGRPANTSDEVRATETRAYATEAIIGKGLGVNISKQEQAKGVEGSVRNWEARQKPPEEKK